MIKIILTAFIALGILTQAACQSSSEETTVSGTATYLQRIALPPESIMTVQIEDTSLADAPARVIGEQRIETQGSQVPISFSVPYDAGEIDENHSYSLRVRIEDGAGNLLFINDTNVPVITRGNPTQDIEVILVPVGG